jgi:transposase
MTLHPQPVLPIPDQTATVTRAAFPKGTPYLALRDELGTIYDDTLFIGLYPRDGQPALSPWQLALVTVLQFAENLPDRQAADAVRSRTDWKYLLGLELTDPGFDYSVLCEFRARLISGNATDLLLDRMLHVRWKPCAGCGCRIFLSMMAVSSGGGPAIFPLAHTPSAHPLTRKHATVLSGKPPGPGIKSTLGKPATLMHRI